MLPRRDLPGIAGMRAGDHYCGIYRTDEEHRAFIAGFVRHGLERAEKVLYIVSLQTAAQLAAALEAGGVDAEPLTRKGQLVVVTAKEAYLRDGEFNPGRMIELLRTEAGKALEQGYAALRVTGEMGWALAGAPGSERIIEYEARLNEFLPGLQCSAVCQYDRRRFDSEMLLEVLQTHPQVLSGVDGLDNSRMYFVPPGMFLGRDRQGAILNRWLENLSAHQRPV